MTDWYYADQSNSRQGPVSPQALAQLRNSGAIHDASLVWRDGLAGWVALREVAHELETSAGEPLTAGVETVPAAGSTASADWALEPTGTGSTPDTEVPDSAAGGIAASPVSATPAPDAWSSSPVSPAVVAGGEAATPYAPPRSGMAPQASTVHGGEVVMAGFLKRVAAYVIDSFIVGIAGGIIGMVIGFVVAFVMAAAGVGGGVTTLVVQLIINLLSLAMTAAYYGWFHSSSSMATPGKMAVGIKVVRTNGEQITLLRGVGRYFATILSAIPLGVGFLMAGFTERKQALHDMVCDTLVVDRWAFTDRPDLQRRDLGTVTIVVLAIVGILTALLVLAIIGAIGVAALN